VAPRVLLDGVADTARWVAHYRALESERADAIVRDPFARRLAGERGRAIAEALPVLSLDWVIPVRARVFDEMILETVAAGTVNAVLNLAAGLDTRPYRLALPASLRWIEVDLPGVVSMKTEALAGERPACALERLPLDLTDGEALRALLARLDAEDARVLVVTEGLLVYLDEGDVRSLARDLFASTAVRAWALEASSPATLARARRGWGKTLQPSGAEMKFAPASGLDFFAEYGWEYSGARALMDEARRLRREMRFAALARALSTMTARGRENWRKIAMYAVVEKRADGGLAGAPPTETIEALRRAVLPGRGWVLFRNGTYVVFTEATEDMSARASDLLREWGPVHPGSPAGDFAVMALHDAAGWIVTCHHPDVLTYVAPDETPDPPTDLAIGLLGRAKRALDAQELVVAHEEPWRRR
jgi:methyltransferase (TIGR00027 family)